MALNDENFLHIQSCMGLKNCGDFLIRDAAAALLEQTTDVSNDEILYVDIVRSELSEESLNQIRSTDVAFLAGGPGYR